jgi:uncharacterized protein (TIGR02147 family)
MVSIFDYLDYRNYLRDEFDSRKRDSAGFSHRNLMRKLSLRAPGHMLFVMQGKRKLTQSLALRLAGYLRLGKKETDYLIGLIRYTDAKTPADKQYAFEELLSLLHRSRMTLSVMKHRFYEKWYYSAVRASLDVEPFRDDYDTLASSLCPPITPSEARTAVEVLLELGMATADESGYVRPADQAISTGDEWQSAVIRNLQRQFGRLGMEAVDRFDKEERDVSHCTVTVSSDSFKVIVKKIRELRTQIIALGCAEQAADRAVQVNLQVFPVYKKNKGRES